MINLRTLLTVASVLMLVCGLGAAVVIYRSAGDETGPVLGYEGGGEAAYPVSPGDSKSYLRDLELYGGKANVLATELRHWLTGLTKGKPLALMVALFSVLASYAAFHAAGRLPEGRGTGNRSKDGA